MMVGIGCTQLTTFERWNDWVDNGALMTRSVDTLANDGRRWYTANKKRSSEIKKAVSITKKRATRWRRRFTALGNVTSPRTRSFKRLFIGVCWRFQSRWLPWLVSGVLQTLLYLTGTSSRPFFFFFFFFFNVDVYCLRGSSLWFRPSGKRESA